MYAQFHAVLKHAQEQYQNFYAENLSISAQVAIGLYICC